MATPSPEGTHWPAVCRQHPAVGVAMRAPGRGLQTDSLHSDGPEGVQGELELHFADTMGTRSRGHGVAGVILTLHVSGQAPQSIKPNNKDTSGAEAAGGQRSSST